MSEVWWTSGTKLTPTLHEHCWQRSDREMRHRESAGWCTRLGYSFETRAELSNDQAWGSPREYERHEKFGGNCGERTQACCCWVVDGKRKLQGHDNPNLWRSHKNWLKSSLCLRSLPNPLPLFYIQTDENYRPERVSREGYGLLSSKGPDQLSGPRWWATCQVHHQNNLNLEPEWTVIAQYWIMQVGTWPRKSLSEHDMFHIDNKLMLSELFPQPITWGTEHQSECQHVMKEAKLTKGHKDYFLSLVLTCTWVRHRFLDIITARLIIKII